MTIALAKDVEEYLQEQVRAGVARDPGELANDVLRCLRDQQRRPFEITPQLEAWLLESADQLKLIGNCFLWARMYWTLRG